MSKIDNEHCQELVINIEDLLTEHTRFKGEKVKSDAGDRTVIIQDRHSSKKFKVTVEVLEDSEELKEFYYQYNPDIKS